MFIKRALFTLLLLTLRYSIKVINSHEIRVIFRKASKGIWFLLSNIILYTIPFKEFIFK